MSTLFISVWGWGAITLKFSKGKFTETYQGGPYAPKQKKEVSPQDVARRIINLQQDLNNIHVKDHYHSVDQRVLGATKFPEAYRIVCETFGLEA